MKPKQLIIALGVGFAVLASAWFFRKGPELAPKPDAGKPAVASGNSSPSVAAPLGAPAPPKPISPERHERELAAQEALAGFPQSFTDAISRRDETLAGDVFEARLSRVPQQSAAIYGFLKPFMDQYPLLWQRPIVVYSYWSSCVATQCDKAAVLARLERENPAFYLEKASCLESWALLMPLAAKIKVPPPSDKLKGLVMMLDACLERNPFSDTSIVNQVQFYLYYLQQSLGAEAARSAYDKLAARYSDIPPLAQLLPGPAREVGP